MLARMPACASLCAADASVWFVTSGIDAVCGAGGTAAVDAVVVGAAVVAGLVVPVTFAVVAALVDVGVEVDAAETKRVTLEPFVSVAPGFGACSTIVPAGLPEDTGVVAALSPNLARVARAWGSGKPPRSGTDRRDALAGARGVVAAPGVAGAVVTTTVVLLECPRRLSSTAASTTAATSTSTTSASSIPAPMPRSRGSPGGTGAGDRTAVSAGETSVVLSGAGQPSGGLEISVTGSTGSVTRRAGQSRRSRRSAE
jgi:hypothetical protein